MDQCRIEEVRWATHAAALSAVRFAVFVEEQQVPRELELDGLDPTARHVLACDAAGRPIGTARLLPDGQIGRVAVLPAWRGQGLGRALMAAVLAIARAAGHVEVFLHAQEQVIPFYTRLGFQAEGDRFFEAGIPHRLMRLRLTPASSSSTHR
ncbi:MAG: GNAT family acetyltransferase YjcF [Candidatus Ozemobacter sibiricus]|jgi:predicted GNAT family N-acyltransferase|uniref:GNAT family acetyltransferase YjcF n=1 Tax=Candidatus Ozemobacter sibiricus TaxID=2268124 RepID=A0A367ZMW0_9BACT|nr:MAG: GNAT family acetyltransferase YjcF [Candidatus Ozemobacter sibiricus]